MCFAERMVFQWPSGLQAVFETSVFGNVKSDLYRAMHRYDMLFTLHYVTLYIKINNIYRYCLFHFPLQNCLAVLGEWNELLGCCNVPIGPLARNPLVLGLDRAGPWKDESLWVAHVQCNPGWFLYCLSLFLLFICVAACFELVSGELVRSHVVDLSHRVACAPSSVFNTVHSTWESQSDFQTDDE